MPQAKLTLRVAAIGAMFALVAPAVVQADHRAATAQGAVEAPGARAPAGQDRLEFLERPTERFRRSIERWQEIEERRAEPAVEFATPESFGVSSATLEAIAACESGGDPAAVSADGTYRGKYQFDTSTWAAVGGSGDPAAAPEAEQDMRAAMLYAQSGASPWPICGA